MPAPHPQLVFMPLDSGLRTYIAGNPSSPTFAVRMPLNVDDATDDDESDVANNDHRDNGDDVSKASIHNVRVKLSCPLVSPTVEITQGRYRAMRLTFDPGRQGLLRFGFYCIQNVHGVFDSI